MKKFLWLIIIIVLGVTGCQGARSPEPEPELPEEQPAGDVEQKPPVEEQLSEEEVIMGDFARLIAGGDSAAVGVFIDEHIDRVCPASAEYMIEMLVVVHQRLAEEMNFKIFGSDYMEALNRDMEGVLRRNLIDNIKDPAIREEFRAVSDSKLRVVRYEETPVVETDWEAIAGLKAYFSEDFARMTVLYDLIQNNRRLYEGEGNKDLVSDILLAESLILENDSGFLRTMLEEIYKKQIGAFLVGPEGSYIGAFMTKSGPDYERITSYKATYEGHDLGRLVDKLEVLETDEFSLIGEVINSHNVFGVHSEMSYLPKSLIEGQGPFTIARVEIPGNSALEEKINRTIDETANSLQSDIQGEKTLFVHPTFGSEALLSLSLSASFSGEEGAYDYRQAFLTIDMTNGERMTLEDFLGLPYDSYVAPLEEILGTPVPATAEFSVESFGISLNLPREGSLYSDYHLITAGELMDLVDYRIFFK